jgi:hypothetical protein
MSPLFTLLVALSYVCMFIAQRFGAEVIEHLHGREARVKATLHYDDVKPDAPLQALCEGYDAHHFDSLSNCVHAAGMVLVFVSLVSFVRSNFKSTQILATLPPIWYLYAWTGHFFIQQDIPAVFVYGMSLRGWLAGEYCSICSLCMGRTVSTPTELVMTAGMVAVHMALLPPIPSWGFWAVESSSKSKGE